ncbi:MAG: hypothetical protein HWE13_10720 [Gammaproteobacteria bacterium]|nr:hypothetical protein [Gammaproteobacteria bacterium]
MMSTSDCYMLPEPSSSSESGVRMEFPGGSLYLYFDYDKDGVMFNHGLLFEKVRAHKYTAESHCPAWKIEKSYDNLVRILDSMDVKELIESTVEDKKSEWQLNHYMIYFDGIGCYEIIAESWKALPEKEGSLNQA